MPRIIWRFKKKKFFKIRMAKSAYENVFCAPLFRLLFVISKIKNNCATLKNKRSGLSVILVCKNEGGGR